jgi:hypothetical protein
MDGYQFSAVRDALAQTFAITPDRMPAFAARLEHLRRSGAMPGRPGKGVKTAYTGDQVDRLAFIIALMRANIEVVTALELIRTQWIAARPGRDSDVALRRDDASIAELFEAARKSEMTVYVTIKIDDFVAKNRLPDIGRFTDHTKSQEGFFGWLAEAENFAGVFNLTALTRKLDAALNETTKSKPPLAGLAKRIVRAGRRRRGEA